MTQSIGTPDTPRRAPATLAATGAIGAVSLSWAAASDNVGVTRYNVHRGTTPGFTPTRREPDRAADGHELHRQRARRGHLLLQGHRRGRCRQRRPSLAGGERDSHGRHDRPVRART